MTRMVLWPLLAGGVTAALLIVWRHFFWHHALIIALAVAALVYTGSRTFQRLRDLHRR